MSQSKACSVSYFLTWFNCQVRTYCPVSTQKKSHNDQHRNMHAGSQKARKSKHDQPVSSCSLLYLYVSCGKQCAKLCIFAEAHQQDIYNKCDKQKDHRIAEAFSEYFFYSGCNGILSKIRINNCCVNIEAFTQTYQYRTEVVNQSTGTNSQNQVSYNCFNCACQNIIPWSLKQNITDQYNKTNHKCRLLQDICCKI